MIDAFVAAGGTVQQLAAMIKAAAEEDSARIARAVPWPALRALAFERDGNVCGYCGTTDGPFEVDHIIPRVKGGENTLNNVRVSCRFCNRSKKDRSAPRER